MINDKRYYLDTFRVKEEDLAVLTAEGLKGGGDYCDLFFENTSYRDILLRDGEVSSGGFHIDYGVGIRVLCGEKTGYAYSESTDPASMRAAARAAAAITAGCAVSGDRRTGTSAGPIPPRTATLCARIGVQRMCLRICPCSRSLRPLSGPRIRAWSRL